MKSIRTIVLLFLLIPELPVGEATAPAQPLVLTIRKEDSHIGFSVTKWAVFREEGRFRNFSGTITFDPRDLSATRVELTIQAESIDSRNEGRDRALRSHEFFFVSRYPTLTFKSTGAKAIDEKTFQIEGDLTIRGVTKRVSVPVRLLGVNHTGRQIGTLAGFETTFRINRNDFTVGEGWTIIGDDVDILLQIGSATGPLATR